MQRKILLSIIGILIIICTIFLSYEKINKTKKINNDNGMFAIFLEEAKDSGKYQKSNLKTWPTEDEYIINMNKSYCENGSILRWNKETKKISLKVTGTDKCYVYFDKSEYGSEKHPHLIQTIEDLVRLSNDVNGGKTYDDEYFLLTNDLDFNDPSDYEDANRTDFKDINGINGNEPLIKELTTGSGFTPIGNNDTNYFQGIFDGGNHKISNLFINQNTSYFINVGFFGCAGKDTTSIKNLTLHGKIYTNRGDTGGFVGHVIKNLTLDNCHSELEITNDSANNTAGGLIGSMPFATNVTINNCTNLGNVSGGSITGGLVSYNNGTLIIKKSINYGEITNNFGEHAGGLLGRDNVATNSTSIINSHNEGMVTGDNNLLNTYMGGLVGLINGEIQLNDSYNIGNVTTNGENGAIIGGLIGRVNKKAIITNSYNANNTIKISPNGFDTTNYIGGLVGEIINQNEISIIKNSYNTGEIINGNRVGGLIGDLRTGIIIDKSYNAGNISVTGEIWSSQAIIGGLIGIVNGYSFVHPVDIIMNSYNTGNIIANNKTTTLLSGLIQNSFSNKIILLNSYNVGNLNLQSNVDNSVIAGLIYSHLKNSQSTENNINIINNVYTLGVISGAITNKYGLGYFDVNTTTNNIKNTYYVNSNTGSNIANIGTSMTLDQMKNQSFVDTLNQNVESIDLESIDSSLKEYTLSKWKLDKNSYPTLIK